MSSAGKSVVLVRGGFVDGAGWKGVYDILKKDGYGVAVVQNPTLSLASDTAATRLILDEQTEPVILVGHSYGGAVITEAGTHEKVAGLVYVAAFVPDASESVNTLISGFPADGPQPPILPPRDGFLFMAESQVPWGLDALGGPVTQPAWRSRPSWYLVATDDRMIPPVAQRTMAERAGAKVTEVPGSHAIYVSSPKVVADLIKDAASL
jgi:pimeloyl-ACP methyl ester carboxylesterase